MFLYNINAQADTRFIFTRPSRLLCYQGGKYFKKCPCYLLLFIYMLKSVS